MKKQEQKEIKIYLPEGYVIDIENSSLEEIKLKKVLPKRWEDLDKEYFKNTYFIGEKGTILRNEYIPDESYLREGWKSTLPTKELAEAMLALSQLLMLRDVYNDGWVPDWKDDNSAKYVIYNAHTSIIKTYIYNNSRVLSFKTDKLRDEFFNNFKDLIEIAKPLI